MSCEAEQPRSRSFYLIIIALLLAVSAATASYAMIANQFAAAPRMTTPGTIGIAAATPSSQHSPLSVDATFDVDDRPGRTSLDIALTQVVNDPSVQELRVVVLLCGAVADDPVFVDNRRRPIKWAPFETPNGIEVFSGALGNIGDCVYAFVPVAGSDESGRLRQALLIGSSGQPPGKTSGARVIYRLPGIVQPPALPERLNLGYLPLPTGSTVRMVVKGAPGDMDNVVSSPQLSNAGLLEWEYELTPAKRPVSNIRITAQLADRQAARERLIFFAGGLVGVSGGALVWFFELTAGAIASGRRTRRRKSEESPVPNRRNPGLDDDRGSVADDSSGSEQAVVNAPDGEFYISSAENQINSALSDFGLDVRERGMRLFRQAGVGFLTVVVLTVIARRARRKT